jgi:hypothetical protein
VRKWRKESKADNKNFRLSSLVCDGEWKKSEWRAALFAFSFSRRVETELKAYQTVNRNTSVSKQIST